jgi:hypothetical protein
MMAVLALPVEGVLRLGVDGEEDVLVGAILRCINVGMMRLTPNGIWR